ncbi:MAG: hypothetical protein JSS86_09665 [Cyanobacteria bacterium SZAS LIN-2]|nr:hypothetical protein [Cyanobacteria bacterium SZAS LIN-3]MBS1996567.1 hypothetical protein [Cyanobacteria bacterium SZAS LIN-2]MBS2006235.1 hypothetical protein [Cyanobacteria bacterium SZAS TMP-1]
MLKLLTLIIVVAVGAKRISSERRERSYQRVLRHVPTEERSLARLQLLGIENTFYLEPTHADALSLRQSRMKKFLADFRGSPQLERALLYFAGEA